jgi:hypothetical protein
MPEGSKKKARRSDEAAFDGGPGGTTRSEANLTSQAHVVEQASRGKLLDPITSGIDMSCDAISSLLVENLLRPATATE